MSDIQEYYKTYYARMGENAYTGDKNADTSRFLFFRRELLEHYENRLRRNPEAAGSAEGASGAAKPRALDIGCGSATFATQNPEYEWYGMDLNTEKTAGKPITATAHDTESTPYPYDTGSFDAVTCSEVIEHVFTPEKIIHESRRVLKRDGTLILSCPNHDWIQNHLTGFQNLVYDNKLSHKMEHIRTYTYASLKTLLNEAGFEIVKHAGTCAHYCAIFNPAAYGVMKMLNEKYGLTVPIQEIHLALGDGFPSMQHTIALVCKKV